MTRTCRKCERIKDSTEFYGPSRSYCKECMRAARRAAYDVEESRRNNWKRYGLKPEDIEELGRIQESACASCRKPFLADRAPCVDHDHETGRVRSLLCHNCNVIIGLAGEDPTVLASCMKYLMAVCDR